MATIVQMYRTDRARAGRTLARLIDYMGAARVHMQRQETGLGEELALTEGYLEIQGLRMGARLRYEIEVPAALRANRIPPAALLTLVENAIKHGLSPRPGGGVLRVTAYRDREWVALNVSDSGVGFRTTSGRGLGLANLRARILGLYGGEASLRLTGATEGGVMATMRLPSGPPPATVVARAVRRRRGSIGAAGEPMSSSGSIVARSASLGVGGSLRRPECRESRRCRRRLTESAV